MLDRSRHINLKTKLMAALALDHSSCAATLSCRQQRLSLVFPEASAVRSWAGTGTPLGADGGGAENPLDGPWPFDIVEAGESRGSAKKEVEDGGE